MKSARGTIEQGNAQILLEILDVSRDRGCLYPEPLRSSRKIVAIGCFNKGC